MRITSDQLRIIQDWADELDRLASAEDQIGSPAAYYLKQLDKALPDLALRIRSLAATIAGQGDELQARF